MPGGSQAVGAIEEQCPCGIAKQLRRRHSGTAISTSADAIANSREYMQLQDLRNVLDHRGARRTRRGSERGLTHRGDTAVFDLLTVDRLNTSASHP
jgi:hypothetical protein